MLSTVLGPPAFEEPRFLESPAPWCHQVEQLRSLLSGPMEESRFLQQPRLGLQEPSFLESWNPGSTSPLETPIFNLSQRDVQIILLHQTNKSASLRPMLMSALLTKAIWASSQQRGAALLLLLALASYANRQRLATSPLADVLSTDALRWSWSFVAVLAGELVATGCMLAYAAQHQQQLEHQQLLEELERLGRQRNQLQQQLRQLEQRRLAPASSEPAAAEPQPPAAAASSQPATATGEQLAAAASNRQAAAAGEQLAAAASSQPAAAAEEQPAAAKGSSASAAKPSRNSTALDEAPVPCRYGCGYVARNSQAERGHLASCPKHPKFA